MADTYVWTAADGTVVPLSDWGTGHFVTDGGTAGLRSPSYTISSAQYAGVDGATVTAVRANPAEPSLGMFLRASSTGAARDKLRALIRAMRPKAGPGTLTVTTEAGAVRSLDCYYSDGLQGSDEGRRGPYYKAVIKFFAPDPFWYGASRSISVSLGPRTNFFSFFPLVLASSQVAGVFNVDLSDTDAPSFPVWTITGPGTNLTLSNTTTGQAITVNTTLATGQTLIIDTTPGSQSVRLSDGTNMLGSVTSDPALWVLQESLNVVSAQMVGATVASSISAVFIPRYAGV